MKVELELPRSAIDKLVEDKFAEVVAGKGPEVFAEHVKKASRLQRVDLAYRVWRNDGFLRSEDSQLYETGADREKAKIPIGGFGTNKGTLMDAMRTSDAPILLPKVMVRVVKEALEPILSLTPLMRTIRYSAGVTITFPAVGAMHAADIGEGEPYPDQKMDIGGGTQVATIGKSGLKVRFTEEMLRYSQYDIMAMHLEAAGRALARHKEQKVANLISDSAAVSFDGDGGTSDHGLPNGRDQHGNSNSTVTLDDLLITYADLVNDGFMPRVLLMNPLGWLIFARDATLRAFGFANGGPLWGQFPPSGNAPNSSVWANGPNLNIPFSNLTNRATTMSRVPNLFPAPLSIIISPFITYNSTTGKTDIFMADPDELGVMVIDEDLTTESWTDPNVDVRATKFRERYAIHIPNQGKGLKVLKNISTAKGFDFEDRLIWDSATQSLPNIVD